MSTSDWIEVIGLVLGGGGGTQLVSKLTRLAVAVENLVKAQEKVVERVEDHERRLARGGL